MDMKNGTLGTILILLLCAWEWVKSKVKGWLGIK
jgi:hypothetical protein